MRIITPLLRMSTEICRQGEGPVCAQWHENADHLLENLPCEDHENVGN